MRHVKAFLLSTNCHLVVAIVLGVVVGFYDPQLALKLKPLGTYFIEILRWLIAPVIFFSILACLAKTQRLSELGAMGLKTIVYFEVLSGIALGFGIVAAVILKPGIHFNLDAPSYSMGATQIDFIATLARTFTQSIHLQILVMALLIGVTMLMWRGAEHAFFATSEKISTYCFVLIQYFLKIIPIAAFGAVAYTVGKMGIDSFVQLGTFLWTLYLTNIIFIFLVLGGILKFCGESLKKLMINLKEEVLIIFSTASSLTAMPSLIHKMQMRPRLDKLAPVIIPAGYTFNLSGSNLYLTFAVVFLAQASKVDIGWITYFSLFLVAMVTSKGATAIPGSALTVVTATISIFPEIPESSLIYLLGIERLLKCRPITNMLGHAVACIAISAWVNNKKNVSSETNVGGSHL